MTNLEKVRAAIIEAVPEIAERVDKEALEYAYWFRLHKSLSDEETLEFVACVKPKITLSDVLRAMKGERQPLSLNGDYLTLDIGIRWYLPANLDDQSPETIDFLTSVLCNK